MKYQNLSDRQFCKVLSADAVDILNAQLPQGVSVHRGNANYQTGSFTLKLTFSKVSEDGTVETPERSHFIEYIDMKSNGVLSADDIDTTFKSGGKTFTIVGFKARARKRPILCTADDGKQYVFEVETVAALVAAQRGGAT